MIRAFKQSIMLTRCLQVYHSSCGQYLDVTRADVIDGPTIATARKDGKARGLACIRGRGYGYILQARAYYSYNYR